MMGIANFLAAEGKAEALLPLLQHGRDISRTAVGCEAFDLYQRQDDPHNLCSWSGGPHWRRTMRTWRRTSLRRVTSKSCCRSSAHQSTRASCERCNHQKETAGRNAPFGS